MAKLPAAFMLAAFCCIFLPHDGEAASFDCARAVKPDEKAICANPDLSALDSEMGVLWSVYRQFPFAMGASGARQDEAQAFLQQREQCGGDLRCLSNAYKARNAALAGEIESAITALVQQAGGGPVSPVPSCGPQPDGDDASALPAPVGRIIAGYGSQCRDLGGKLANPGDVRILTGDIDGDGEPDFLINTDRLDCDGAASAFCANAGCQIDIALSSRGYVQPESLTGGVPALVQRPKAVVVQLEVSPFNCKNASRQDRCVATYRWHHGKLEPRYRVDAGEND
jgi:hypothetical protein